MRIFAPTLACLLVGCSGSLTVNGGVPLLPDDDDDATDDDDAGDDDDAADDDDAGDDDDATGEPQVFCGPVLGGFFAGDGLYYAGEATLQAQGGNGRYSWTGCEVARRYEAGELVCEDLWQVSGTTFGGGERALVFEMSYRHDAAGSTCGNQGLDYANIYLAQFRDGGSVALAHADSWAGEQTNWLLFAESGYSADDQFAVIEFEYVTEFWDQ